MAAGPGAENPDAPQLVLMVHSYSPDHAWSRTVGQGVQEALRGARVTLEHLYLDAKRDQDPESLKAKAKALAEYIEASRPQAVIASDDAAQQYLVVPYLKGRAAPQVFFCGVNAPLSLYGYPASNVSGVRERWHFRQSFDLLQRIAPKARRAVLLTDDSETSAFILADVREDLAHSGPYALALGPLGTTGTFQQWQSKVRRAQASADALALVLYHSLRDERTGATVPMETVMAWTNANNRLPTVGFTDYVTQHGILCGVLESGHEQGFLAGSMTRLFLERRVPASQQPVRVNQRGTVYLNLRTAERLRLSIPYEIIEAAGVLVK
ncbi:MAG: hypothetical protein HY916_12705 [Desulfovibrio sp.]|nr:hypothetical protein [Desulfovibrio sp.]